MCGISGFIDPSLSREEGRVILNKTLDIQHHRGPDAQGEYVQPPVYLGHNRLAILDLSKQGAQPMHDAHLSLVFNGEIYNYVEIKKQLEKEGYNFNSETDTEVILKSYQKWGVECVQRFRGMWAFALWDANEQVLFCSRDRFGIKPFYYLHFGNQFYFASEIKALKVSPIFSSELNLNQIARSTQLGWSTYRYATHFARVMQLEASYNLIFKDGHIELSKYYNLEPKVHSFKSFEERKEALAAHFQESIKQHMRADVEVGSCLSGGIDSSSIVSTVQNLFPNTTFKTFTVFYEGKSAVDERPFVRKVLEKYPDVQNFEISPKGDEISDAYEKSTYYHDIPLSGSSYISQYFVMQLASIHKMKVLLDGQGADEYFAGYPHSYQRFLADKLRKLDLLGYFKEHYLHIQNQGYGFKKSLDLHAKTLLHLVRDKNQLYELEFYHYHPFPYKKDFGKMFHLETPYKGKLDNFLYNLLTTTFLPTLLHYEDRNSSAFSIEARVPFLDHKLVELVMSYPNEDKINKGYTKYILRQALADVLPKDIAERRDKKGFVTPGEVLWLRNELKWLLDLPLKLDFVNAKMYQSEIKRFKAGDNSHAKWLWGMVSLNYWIGKI